METKVYRSWLCAVATSISIILFTGIAFAASKDTTNIKSPTVERNNYGDLTRAGKSQIPEHTPEWTDHRPSDPGIPIQSIQDKVNIQTPTQNVRPVTNIGVPAQQPSRPQPSQVYQAPVQPGVNVQTPDQKFQTLDPRYTPPPRTLSMPQPGITPRSPVGATPTSPSVNDLGRPKMNNQSLGRLQQMQEAATAAEVFEQIRIMKEAEIGLPGAADSALGKAEFEMDHADTNAILQDLYGLNTPEGILQNAGPDYSAGSSGPGMKKQYSVGGPVNPGHASWEPDGSGTGREGGGFDLLQALLGLAEEGAKTGGKAALGFALSTLTIWEGMRGTAGGDPLENQPNSTIVDSDGDGIVDTSVQPEGDTDGDGVPDSSVQPQSGEGSEGSEGGEGQAGQPSDFASKGSDGCNWNPHWGRCMNKQRTVKEKQDDRTSPTRGDADTGESTSVSGIGPEAVTNPSEFHSRGGTSVSGSKMWEGITESGGTPEPPPPPSGANIDEALGAFD